MITDTSAAVDLSQEVGDGYYVIILLANTNTDKNLHCWFSLDQGAGGMEYLCF